MPSPIPPCTHARQFHQHNHAAERGTRWVVLITAITMVIEIVSGWWFNAMALLADGWHMASHTAAIGLSSAAYVWSRRLQKDGRFAFGTWKIEVLGGFASAVLMAVVAVMMVAESVHRLFVPESIQYPEAMAVTVLGLAVNLLSAKLLGHAHHHHDHDHDHDHDHGHDHGHGDLNLKAAYVHVLADAATSVFALLALAGAWWLNWVWLDPIMGLVGAALVGTWALSLLRQTGRVLLDGEMDQAWMGQAAAALKERFADHPLLDWHLWRVGENTYAAAITLSGDPGKLDSQRVRACLAAWPQIGHATIEIRAPQQPTPSGHPAPEGAQAPDPDPTPVA